MLIYTTREKRNKHEKDNYGINRASSLGNCFKFCFVAATTGKTLRRNNSIILTPRRSNCQECQHSDYGKHVARDSI